MNMTLAQLQAWLPLARPEGKANALPNTDAWNAVRIQAVRTDSRSVVNGDLFVALKGENFDGSAFLAQAQAQGAVAVLLEDAGATRNALNLKDVSVPVLCVPNVREALGELSAAWRSQFDLALVGVAGSNGKTTVTQMIASILREDPARPSLATQGNFNNEIGVPLTLFNLRAQHQRAVVELGMNHPGEIAVLARYAAPTVALVNNAQREHQEFMATVQAVAEENGQVIRALPANGVAVFPAQDEFTSLWKNLAGARSVMCFGFDQGQVQAHALQWAGGAWQFDLVTPTLSLPCRLQIAGRHNVLNALAAATCALAAGVDLPTVVRGLETFEAVKGRSKTWHWVLGEHRMTVVDDTYNANPDSVRAAIDVLAELPASRLLVLGDMGEVGNQGQSYHAEVGAYAQSRGIQALFTLGDLSQASSRVFKHARHFQDMASLQAAVTHSAVQFQSILVKGSRFMKMEQVVQALEQQAQPWAPASRESEAVHAA
ncbi:MAG: UDP-N-acetylmuramoyl-tripeptide--D-alanyl-D-alanine ligase [Burkholderiales bacterium]|jgi:UDP-N-acetylmuramoyl-tripeptide--D-alanyl-D-alanine ligase|nr:UDP-N-acetylmuramoyl-tripeptide--D-alanyl-D-alanine ligase [Burkholderiales bacterium]